MQAAAARVDKTQAAHAEAGKKVAALKEQLKAAEVIFEETGIQAKEAVLEMQTVKRAAGEGLAEATATGLATSMQHVLGQHMEAKVVQSIVEACMLHFQQMAASSAAGVPLQLLQHLGQQSAGPMLGGQAAASSQQQPAGAAWPAAMSQGQGAAAAALGALAAQAQQAQALAATHEAAAAQARQTAAEAAQVHARAAEALQAAGQQQQLPLRMPVSRGRSQASSDASDASVIPGRSRSQSRRREAKRARKAAKEAADKA